MQPRFPPLNVPQRCRRANPVEFKPRSAKPRPTPSSSACFEDAPLTGAAAEVDAALGGAIRGLDRTARNSPAAATRRRRCWCPWARPGRRCVVGLGNAKKFDAGTAFRAAAAAARHLAAQAARAAWRSFSTTAGRPSGPKAAWPARSSAARARICIAPKRIGIRSARLPGRAAAKRRSPAAASWARAVNLTRRLVNEPADEIYPETFAARAAEVAKQNGLEVEIWDEKRLADRALRLAVGRGQGLEPPGAAGDLALSRRRQERAHAGHRRQGRDVRLRRTVAQAARRHADDEVRQGRRLDHGRRHAGHRPAEAAGQRDRHRRAGREHDRAGGHEAGRRAHGPQRPHDRSAQHRRRGPAGAGRCAVAWPSTWASARSSTWPR